MTAPAIFRCIGTLLSPQLRSTLLMILLIRIMDSVKMYDIPHILTGGGPANATQFISEYIYRRSFDSYKFGESAAGSISLRCLWL